jgi:predicted PurR-regulated permease PerM
MEILSHLRTTGTALKNWFIAQTYDALAVGALWLIGLLIIGVPWAPLWAFLGAVLQYIPNFGPVLTVILAELGALFTGSGMKMLYVLIVYAVIVVVDGLVLQPYIMKRTAKVPIWASIFVPIFMGFLFSLGGPLSSFLGVLLSPPLLAVVYAYRERYRNARLNPKPPDAAPNAE